ncbi:MAG: hypothetical protein GX957_01190, partial [Clostridiaceae bacterium]|nr:hypothetical protein [Clostridiaceae bacterium]
MAQEYDDNCSVTINKNLAVNGGTNPSETFSFAIGEGTGERDGATFSAPEFDSDTFTITVGQGGTTGSADLDLPEFTQVGVYTYPISEDEGDTAGMRYDDTPKNLVVTVINNPDYDSQDEESQEFLRVITMT